MATELKVLDEPQATKPHGRPFFKGREGRILRVTLLGALTLSIFTFLFYYIKFAHLVDQKLTVGPFSDTIDVFAAPRTIAVGDAVTLPEVVTLLRNSGYSATVDHTRGWFLIRRNALEIFPGRNAYPGDEPGILEFSDGKISRISSPKDNTPRKEYRFEPQLIANFSGQREKRHLVRFGDIPPSVVHALISAEDKHFFYHSGFGPRVPYCTTHLARRVFAVRLQSLLGRPQGSSETRAILSDGHHAVRYMATASIIKLNLKEQAATDAK